MSPITVSEETGGQNYMNPFVGPVEYTHPVLVDLSDLSTDEVDDDGVLKPGVPLKEDGTLADGTAGEHIFGCVAEATSVADDNANLATDPDVEVAVATIGQVNRDALEDNLGRALTANEVAAFGAAGCHVVLLE